MTFNLARNVKRAIVAFACTLASTSMIFGYAASLAPYGQGFGRQQSVGGISVDAAGVVRNANIEARQKLRAALLAEIKKGPEWAESKPLQLRMVPSKGLEAAITAGHKEQSTSSE